MGSGICAFIAARDALGFKAQVVGVVSAHAPAYARSFAARRAVEAPATTQIADGLACRTPPADALVVIWRAVDRVIEVDDDAVRAAMRLIFECTHNVAEGAGAAAVAAALAERDRIRGRRIAVLITGGNVDRELFARALDGA
jgi:threonine dehydratase